ncbi:hypothetical protein D3C80_1771630 [compost metagenome]
MTAQAAPTGVQGAGGAVEVGEITGARHQQAAHASQQRVLHVQGGQQGFALLLAHLHRGRIGQGHGSFQVTLGQAQPVAGLLEMRRDAEHLRVARRVSRCRMGEAHLLATQFLTHQKARDAEDTG